MNKNHNTGIYKITNSVTGKCYVGSASTIKKRCKQHFSLLEKKSHHSIKLQRSYNKYGKDNFIFSVILFCEKKDLIFYEQQCIDFFNSEKLGYNMNPIAGSSIGVKRTEEQKKLTSEIMKEKWNDPEYRERLTQSSIDSWTPEKRKKQRDKMTGTIQSDDQKIKASISGKKRFEDKDAAARQKEILDNAREHPKRKENVSKALKTPEYRKKQSEIITEWWRKRKEKELNMEIVVC